MGMFGRVVFTEEITKLQEQGFISQLDITKSGGKSRIVVGMSKNRG